MCAIDKYWCRPSASRAFRNAEKKVAESFVDGKIWLCDCDCVAIV
jgi:hypothetical protein